MSSTCAHTRGRISRTSPLHRRTPRRNSNGGAIWPATPLAGRVTQEGVEHLLTTEEPDPDEQPPPRGDR